VGSLQDIREIERHDVVASDNIGVNQLDEFFPSHEHVLFILETEHLGTNDGRAGFEREYISNERLALVCKLAQVCNLDD
jgi:hypothetical protein